MCLRGITLQITIIKIMIIIILCKQLELQGIIFDTDNLHSYMVSIEEEEEEESSSSSSSSSNNHSFKGGILNTNNLLVGLLCIVAKRVRTPVVPFRSISDK